MLTSKVLNTIIAFLCFVFLSSSVPVFAESTSIQATVGDTGFVLEGYTSPGAIVTFLDNNVVIGSTLSDSTGKYSKAFTAQNPGPRVISVYGSDAQGGLKTATITVSFLVTQFETLTISNLNLPPTFRTNKTSFSEGDEIVISGYTKPGSFVEIIQSGTNGKSYFEQADGNGFYELKIPKGLPEGTFLFSVKLQGMTAGSSSESLQVSVSISKKGTSSGGSSSSGTDDDTTSDISVTPTPGTFLTPDSSKGVCSFNFAKLCFFDDERNGQIESEEELLTFLYGFAMYFSTPVGNAFDINEDGVVDSEDLSIVLYYATPTDQRILGLTTVTSLRPSVLGVQSDKLEFTSIFGQNNPMEIFLTLAFFEIIIGLPFFLLFIILIIITRNKHHDRE